RGIGDKCGWISGARWRYLPRNLLPSGLFNRRHNFLHRMPATGAKIERHTGCSNFVEVLQCKHVPFSKVVNVDIVADASTVRSGIVRPKKLQGWPRAGSGGER